MNRMCNNCRYFSNQYDITVCNECVKHLGHGDKWESKISNPPANCIGIYSLNGYQKAALRTAGMETQAVKFSNFGLGLSGEAGEVTDYLKKVLYHGHKLDKHKLCKELGDVLWYVATLADTAGLTLEEVARVNIDKLRQRYPDGFSKERSIEREENDE